MSAIGSNSKRCPEGLGALGSALIARGWVRPAAGMLCPVGGEVGGKLRLGSSTAAPSDDAGGSDSGQSLPGQDEQQHRVQDHQRRRRQGNRLGSSVVPPRGRRPRSSSGRVRFQARKQPLPPPKLRPAGSGGRGDGCIEKTAGQKTERQAEQVFAAAEPRAIRRATVPITLPQNRGARSSRLPEKNSRPTACVRNSSAATISRTAENLPTTPIRPTLTPNRPPARRAPHRSSAARDGTAATTRC